MTVSIRRALDLLGGSSVVTTWRILHRGGGSSKLSWANRSLALVIRLSISIGVFASALRIKSPDAL